MLLLSCSLSTVLRSGRIGAPNESLPLIWNEEDDKYLKRTLALELLRLDELQEAFRDKGIVRGDVADGALLIKVAERRATLLGMNAPLGHAVQVIQHEPVHQPTSTDRIEAAFKELRLMKDRAQGDPAATDQDDPATN